MLRILAFLYAVLFVAIGIFGFLPEYSKEGLLFGYFAFNPVHSTLSIIIGLIALFCSLSNRTASKLFFIVFGLAFVAYSAYGFYTGSELVFDMIANNKADNIFHLVIGLLSLYFGFAFKINKTA